MVTVLNSCAYEPDERPSFLEIVRKLKEIMQELDDTEVRVQLASVDVIPTTPARSSQLGTSKGRPKTLAKLKGQSRRFSWFKRSVSFHEQTLERMQAVDSMGCGLSILDSTEFVEAVNRCLSPSVESAWYAVAALCSYCTRLLVRDCDSPLLVVLRC